MPSKRSSSGGSSKRHGEERRSSKDERQGVGARGGSSRDGHKVGGSGSGSSRDDRSAGDSRSGRSKDEGSKHGGSQHGSGSAAGSTRSSRGPHDPNRPVVRDFAPTTRSASQRPSATLQIIRDFATAALSTSGAAAASQRELPSRGDSPSTGDELDSIGTSELGEEQEEPARPARSRGSQASHSTGDDLRSIGTSSLGRAFERAENPTARSRGSHHREDPESHRRESVTSGEILVGIDNEDTFEARRRPARELRSFSGTGSDAVSELVLPDPALDSRLRNPGSDAGHGPPRIVKVAGYSDRGGSARVSARGYEGGSEGGSGDWSSKASEISSARASLRRSGKSLSNALAPPRYYAPPTTPAAALAAATAATTAARSRGSASEASIPENASRTWTSSSDFKGRPPSEKRELQEMEAQFKKLGVALGYDPKHYEDFPGSSAAKKQKLERSFLVGPSETESNVASSGAGELWKEYVREARANREKQAKEGLAPGLESKPSLIAPHLSHMRPRKRSDEHRTESIRGVAEPMTAKDREVLGIVEKDYVGFDDLVRPRVRRESVSSVSTTCSTPRLQSSGEQSTESAYKKEEVRRLQDTAQTSSHSGTPDYKPTTFVESPRLEHKESLSSLTPLAIPKSGKVLPKGEFGRIEEQLKDCRQMMADALAFAQRFSDSSKCGWGAQAKAQADSGNTGHLSQRINYALPKEFAHRVCKEVYKNELVHRYDAFVTKNRGLSVSHLKRLAEDDAASGAHLRPDKERYQNWLELRLFCKEEEKKTANTIRYQKNSRVKAMKIAEEKGVSLDEAIKLHRKGSVNEFSKFKPDG